MEDFEARVIEWGYPLQGWKWQEREWQDTVTSKEASDNPRILKRLKNPYEPAEETCKSSGNSLYYYTDYNPLAPSEKQIIATLNAKLEDLVEHSATPGGGVRLGEFLKQGIDIQEMLCVTY